MTTFVTLCGEDFPEKLLRRGIRVVANWRIAKAWKQAQRLKRQQQEELAATEEEDVEKEEEIPVSTDLERKQGISKHYMTLAVARAAPYIRAQHADLARHAPINGHICGRDDGKDVFKKQPRNQPCTCGSGLKAKKCCVYDKTQEVEVKK